MAFKGHRGGQPARLSGAPGDGCFPHEVEDRLGGFLQSVGARVIRVRQHVQPRASSRLRMQDMGIVDRHRLVSATVEKQYGCVDPADRVDGRECSESLSDRVLDVTQRQGRQGTRQMLAKGASHEGLGVGHRSDGDDRRHIGVGCRDEEASPGAHGVSDQDDASAIDIRRLPKQCEAGAHVLGEARQGGELVVITASVAARVEHQNMESCGAQWSRKGKHVRRAGAPAVDDESSRAWLVGTSSWKEPAPHGTAVDGGERDVFGVRGKVGEWPRAPRRPAEATAQPARSLPGEHDADQTDNDHDEHGETVAKGRYALSARTVGNQVQSLRSQSGITILFPRTLRHGRASDPRLGAISLGMCAR